MTPKQNLFLLNRLDKEAQYIQKFIAYIEAHTKEFYVDIQGMRAWRDEYRITYELAWTIWCLLPEEMEGNMNEIYMLLK